MSKYLDQDGVTHLTEKIQDATIVAGKAKTVPADGIEGVIDISHIPQGALERLVKVTDETARYKLTTDNVQLGDTVLQTSDGKMFIVIDESNLANAGGYQEYAAGKAASADYATKAASADTANAVAWDNVTGKPSSFTPSSHTHTKSQITDFPTTMKNPNSITVKLNGGTTEGTDMFTYDGSAAKLVNITPESIDALGLTVVHTDEVDSFADAIGILYNTASTDTSGGLPVATGLIFAYSNSNVGYYQTKFDGGRWYSRYKSATASSTWSAWDATWGVASTTANGFMTSAMVTKLNGIATGATADSALTDDEIDAAIAAAN